MVVPPCKKMCTIRTCSVIHFTSRRSLLYRKSEVQSCVCDTRNGSPKPTLIGSLTVCPVRVWRLVGLREVCARSQGQQCQCKGCQHWPSPSAGMRARIGVGMHAYIYIYICVSMLLAVQVCWLSPPCLQPFSHTWQIRTQGWHVSLSG